MFKSVVDSWINSFNDKYLFIVVVESIEGIRKLYINRWILVMVELRIFDNLWLGFGKRCR